MPGHVLRRQPGEPLSDRGPPRERRQRRLHGNPEPACAAGPRELALVPQMPGHVLRRQPGEPLSDRGPPRERRQRRLPLATGVTNFWPEKVKAKTLCGVGLRETSDPGEAC